MFLQHLRNEHRCFFEWLLYINQFFVSLRAGPIRLIPYLQDNPTPVGFTPVASSASAAPIESQVQPQRQLVEDDDSDDDDEVADPAVGQPETRDGTLLASDRARPLPSNQVTARYRLFSDGYF